MVLGFAEQTGGKLALASEPGKGTTVELWLPVSTAAIGARAQAQSAQPRTGPPLSILVVDDDPLVLTNTVAMLEEFGHEVAEASSGKEALRMLEEKPADLIVTDYAMPGMTGDQLAIRAQALRPALPVLLVSGYAELPEDAGQGLERLAKPFTEAELAGAVEAAVRRSGTAAPA
jgi:CheY-like chemotaxis protein